MFSPSKLGDDLMSGTNDRNGLTRRTILGGAAALALPRLAGTAAAATAEKVDIAAAKKEGKVVLYTSAPLSAAQKVANAFQQKYGINVELFRTGGVQVLRRFLMEQQAGHAGTDVLVSSDLSAIKDLAAKGSFVSFHPVGIENIPEPLRDPEGFYVPQRVSVISIYGRTDLVPPAEMPKTWSDLLDPKFKSKLVMTNPNFTSLQLVVVTMMSKAHGWDYFEKLNKNDIMVVQGNEQALNLVKTGERPIAAGADSQYATNARFAGHKIANVFPSDGTFVIPSTTSVVKGSANPNAAKLLAEFSLSDEAQGLWPKSGIYAARSDIAPPEGNPSLKTIKVLPIDYAYLKQNGAAVKKRFSEIFSV
jgi:iron(III) transport system substrate-binding protein